MAKFTIIIFLIFSKVILFSQEDIYISESGKIVTFPDSQIAIFGNIINDAIGGFTHSKVLKLDTHKNAGTVFLIRHHKNGKGNTRIYSGPRSKLGIDYFNTNGSYCRFWNLITDNTTGTSIPSKTLVNEDFGTGNFQIEQEIRINGKHQIINGMIWTPRSKWKNVFVHYEKLLEEDTVQIVGASNDTHIDGYAMVSGLNKSFVFPIGDGKRLRICGVEKNSNNKTRAAYFNVNPVSVQSGLSGELPLPSDTLNYINKISKISRTEFWDIDLTDSIAVFLSANNSENYYSEWHNRFENPSNIIITGFDGQWNDLGMNKVKHILINDSIFMTKTFLASPKYSLFTWAQFDSSIVSVNSTYNSKKYSIIEQNQNNLTISYSFGYPCNSLISIYDISGKLLFMQNQKSIPNENIFQLPERSLTKGLLLINILSSENEILFFKYLNK